MDADRLAILLTDPTRADALPREALPEVLGQVERLKAVLWARLSTPEVASNGRPVSDTERASGDRLLTVQELAERLNVDDRWIYRKADDLPFTRRLGDRTLRFSEQGLERWLARQ
jgi:excisionase family DNA binding protein